MSAPAPETLRRGWCPSTLRPMETGDGWLVRLHPPGSVLTPAQLGRIAALARETGNGLVEISARGNLQLRGVRPDAHPALVAVLLADNLVDEPEGDGPARLTIVSPLAGDDPGDFIDAAALAAAIEHGVRGLAGLPAKLSVTVDGGGLPLDGAPADLRLRAIARDTILIGFPDGSWRGPVTPEQAVCATLDALAAFAELHRHAPETIRRLRDLAGERLAALTGLPRIGAPPPRPAAPRAGLFSLRDGSFAALLALPFGRSDAGTLGSLARSAVEAGARAIRLSLWRGLAILGLRAEAAHTLLARAETLGLITRADDPRLRVQACAGLPACTRGETDAMADAAMLAEAAAELLAAGTTLHVSACVKSCAHPGRADLTLVGSGGRYDVVIAGTTRDAPFERLDLSQILPRLRPGQDLHARLGGMARLSERTR